MIQDGKRYYTSGEVSKTYLALAITTFILGFVFSFSVFEREKVEEEKELDVIYEVYNDILTSYYGDVDRDLLIDGAIKGMTSVLGDDYTTYLNEEENEAFNMSLDGNYVGMGARIALNSDGELYIFEAFKDSPAEKAGLLNGDVILKIDDTETKDITTSEASNLIMGEAGTDVVLTIKRLDETFDVTITRGSVEIPYVTSSIVYDENNDKIGYIGIELFASVTSSQFKSHLEELEKQNITGLIVDVRNNGGGYLNVAESIINMFTEKDTIIYRTSMKGSITAVKDTTRESRDYKVVVLANEYSASASEILASSLQEAYGANVVGTTTFGKGTVQRPFELSSGGMLKITIENWLTADGNVIDKTGITPDYEVSDMNEQLDKAIELLK